MEIKFQSDWNIKGTRDIIYLLWDTNDYKMPTSSSALNGK